MRIHIGNISASLAENVRDLRQRLEKFAPIEGDFELRRKPHGDFYFAFVEMPTLDTEKYVAMRKALNGLLFRQSKLSVGQASKPDYTVVLEQRQAAPEPLLTPEQLKRHNSTLAHLDGRMRESSRDEKDIRGATFRVMLDGRIRKPKMRKTKLWGVEKKPINSLVNVFDDDKKEWRDSTGRPIEFVGVDEHERNLRLLDTVSADYLSDSDFDEYKKTRVALPEREVSDDDLEIVSKSNQVPSADRSDESDSESDYESIIEAAKKAQSLTSELKDELSGETEPAQPEALEAPQGEVLRSAFSVDTPFTLFGAPDTEAADATKVSTSATALPAPTEKKSQLGLFFAHFESPFLRSQSQAAKIAATAFSVQDWETQFWASRGEWNRAMRRQRREVAKKQRRQR